MSNLFKTSKSQDAFRPPGFTGGGLTGAFLGSTGGAGGYYSVTPDANRTDLVSGLSNAGGNAADTYQSLYNTVAPGFNDLLASRLAQYNDTATKAIGDLRQNLQSRRILGSSFGNDTLQRSLLQQGQDRQSIAADNFLKSLDAQRQLTSDQFNARQQQFNAGLNELNLEAGLAKDLSSNASSQLAQNARADAAAQNTANQSYSGAIIGGLTRIASAGLSAGLGGFGGFGGFGGASGSGSVPTVQTYGSGGLPYVTY